MMRKWFLPLLLLIIVAVIVCYRYPTRPRWTTDSEAARQELEQGLDADMKFYQDDAREHFARAVALDPGFLVAKERLARTTMDREQRRALAEEVRQADLGTVTPGERFLLRFWLAQMDQDRERAEAILQERLREAPEDPFALDFAARRALVAGDRKQAEALNRKLIEVEPNWINAQNMLGYLAMEDGDFRQSEEHFKTYQYIAPDQANPHDSMGELLVLLGRYEEAEQELEMALGVRSDFTPAYINLLWIALFEQDAAKARAILDRVAALPEQTAEDGEPGGESQPVMAGDLKMARSFLEQLTCRRDMHLGYLTGDWQGAWDRSGPCMMDPTHVVVGHQISLILGADERAASIRAKFQENVEQDFQRAGLEPDAYFQARFLHMDGNTWLAAGEPRRAVEHFRQADALLTFAGDHEALFKLRNLGHLAAAWEAAGESAEAAAAWQRVEAVNPHIRPFLEAGLKPLLARQAAAAPESD